MSQETSIHTSAWRTRENVAAPLRAAEPIRTAERASPPVLGDRWPTLAAALGRYQQNVAETFCQEAASAITNGLLRLDERRRLAALAEQLGIRPFDAQLLIACAIRQWALDHHYEVTPSPQAPRLSFEYRAWRLGWMRFALVAGLAVILDGVILWGWLR